MEKFKQKHIKVDEQEKPEENVSKEEEPEVGPRSKTSLLDQHSELKKKAAGLYVCITCTCTMIHYIYYMYNDTLHILHLVLCVQITFFLFLLAHKVSELDKQKQEEQKILHNIQETRGKSSFLSVVNLFNI